jgi:phage gpG-like protein
MKIEIGVEGEEKLERALKGAVADLSDLRPAWRPVSDELFSITRAQFATQGARGPAGKWEKRADSTVDRYSSINRRGFTVLNETLRRTDAMFKAVTLRRAPHGIYDEQADSLTVGTDLPYAAIHQKGGPKIPQRKIYDLTERDAARLMSILKRGLMKKIEDRGFDFVDSAEIPF